MWHCKLMKENEYNIKARKTEKLIANGSVHTFTWDTTSK